MSFLSAPRRVPTDPRRAGPAAPPSGRNEASAPPPAAVPSATRKVACPNCGQTAGFLLDLDGVSFRVLEDEHDTDLVEEALPEKKSRVLCPDCGLRLTPAAALALPVQEPAPMPKAHRRKSAGKAKTRTSADGRTLPVCPSCGATHRFFVDLDGVAYRVLEDDFDTDLLSEASNLLCENCNAVFEL